MLQVVNRRSIFAVAMLLLLPAGLARARSAAGAPAGQSPAPWLGTQTPASETLTAPAVNVGAPAAHRYESNPILSLPDMFARQWMPSVWLVPSERYLPPQPRPVTRLTLKETIYMALRGNPGLAAVALDPVAATESVKAANAQFDPALSAQLDEDKQVSPVSSPFQNPGTVAQEVKFYDWNFGVSKVLALTNATASVAFENDREETNSAFSPINPVYTPLLQMSLSQPLLQNFGWQFATINVEMAKTSQRGAQWNYGSNLNDFVQRIGNDYWGMVGAEQNLTVAQAALKFDTDLVRINALNVRVGMLPKVDLYQARSAAATARANLSAAQAALEIARTTLRQDVALKTRESWLGQEIEPAQTPRIEPSTEERELSDEEALTQMFEYSPALGAMRETIESAMLQVKYAENQTLPQLNIGAAFGLTSEAGHAYCTAGSGTVPPSYANCYSPNGPVGYNPNAAVLPFGGVYADALNRMFDARFYDYAAVLTFSMPLNNAAAKAALAQARVAYDQARFEYRQAVMQSVLLVKSALANLRAYQVQGEATREAVDYAAETLRVTQAQFHVGMATTNQLLQYQSNLVSAQGNQVQADIGLENARLALWHSEGTLLRQFNIQFQLQAQPATPWYARF